MTPKEENKLREAIEMITFIGDTIVNHTSANYVPKFYDRQTFSNRTMGEVS